MRKNKVIKENGITLVALVITVIILIILAGVSLNLALGENGIFVKSKEAVDKYKDEAQKEQNTLENMYKDMQTETGGDDTSTAGTLDVNNLTIGEAINAKNYGEMTDYTSNGDEEDENTTTTGGWRLFYQDEKCTYLISDNLVYESGTTGFKPSDYYTEYQSGANVSIVGQRLNSKLIGKNNVDNHEFFGTENKKASILATAWLTDTENELWSKYKNDDAEFAIGSPTIELYVASFNAAADAAKVKNPNDERTKIEAISNIGDYGYDYDEEEEDIQLKEEYNSGIYFKNNEDWWLSSPLGNLTIGDFEFIVDRVW